MCSFLCHLSLGAQGPLPVPGGWFRTREARGVCTCRSCCDSSLVTTALQLRAPFITVDQTLAPAENGSEDNTIFHL